MARSQSEQKKEDELMMIKALDIHHYRSIPTNCKPIATNIENEIMFHPWMDCVGITVSFLLFISGHYILQPDLHYQTYFCSSEQHCTFSPRVMNEWLASFPILHVREVLYNTWWSLQVSVRGTLFSWIEITPRCYGTHYAKIRWRLRIGDAKPSSNF